MHGPREVLNELKWREGALAEADIFYVHRGAPNDTRVARGDRVRALARSFLVLGADGREAWIPYHRVFRIKRHGTRVWERRAPDDVAREP